MLKVIKRITITLDFTLCKYEKFTLIHYIRTWLENVSPKEGIRQSYPSPKFYLCQELYVLRDFHFGHTRYSRSKDKWI